LAVTIDEVKDIRDQAAALRAYAMQARDRVLLDHVTEIRLRAERRAGEILKEMAQAGERAVRKNMKSQPATSKLSDLNINKSQSSRWQKLADVPTDDFEELVANAQQKAGAAVDRAQQPKPEPKPKPKPEPEPRRKQPGGNGAAAERYPTTTCLTIVTGLLREAIETLGAEERSIFLDELRKTISAIVAEAMARHANTDQWEETTV
jgi:hypothetical protein